MNYFVKNIDRLIAWAVNVIVGFLALVILLRTPKDLELSFIIAYNLIVLTALITAVIATIFIEKKWLSIILFIIASIAVMFFSLGYLWFLALAYLIVAIIVLIKR